MASTKDIGLGAPIWGCPFTLRFPVGTDVGDLETGLAAAADSEVSLDGGAFADCANEIVEIGTDGWYSITLEAAEMQASSVAYKMISGDYGYHATLYPVRCGTVATGTAAAGGAATLTLANGSTIVDDEYVGYILQLTGGTGSGQAARIIDAMASTRVLTVQADWLTQPDETTTYAVLIPPERDALASVTAAHLAATVTFDGTTNKTVAECYQAAWGQGAGKWDIVENVFTIYAPDGTTALFPFTLDNADAPSSRTPA